MSAQMNKPFTLPSNVFNNGGYFGNKLTFYSVKHIKIFCKKTFKNPNTDTSHTMRAAPSGYSFSHLDQSKYSFCHKQKFSFITVKTVFFFF